MIGMAECTRTLSCGDPPQPGVAGRFKTVVDGNRNGDHMIPRSTHGPHFLTWFACILLLFTCLAHAAERKAGAFHGAVQTEYPSWFKSSFLNLREDIAEAQSKNKRVMLLFTQDGCPYCHALVERNLSQKDIETYLRKHFDVIAINMWGDREVVGLDNRSMTEKQFAARLKVQFTPTILFFDEAGQTVLRLNGYIPPARFMTALQFAAQGAKESDYLDYLAAHQPPATGSELIDEPFFRKPPFNLVRKGGKDRPIAVFFEQRDCPACAELHHRILSDKQTRGIIAGFDAIQLNMWSDTPLITPQGKATTARAWARALDIKYAPSIVLFDAKGKEIIRSEAYFKLFHTQGILTYVLSGAYETEPSFQRYLSAKSEHLREQGQDVDIWRMGDEPAGKK
ncbi:thioredoxin fold domain-containing protein [Thiobacillus sedimenti]|uniref:Thioredoxin fold domain-containing protein n=1 Tax=Thiobacillus sedimenti TaxID=3110231 RepID=A0ABZ1CGJ1_9PROT|nr:thioredoxin fold domain-containing protein [Thiobacillus sp. SCUT-2]WRS38499.1 thioredoxin fold domain-containing protein [Thiobacillus sp. SCUT-2]